MKTKILIFLIALIGLGAVGFFLWKQAPLQKQGAEPISGKTRCQFEIREVFFKESEDPQIRF